MGVESPKFEEATEASEASVAAAAAPVAPAEDRAVAVRPLLPVEEEAYNVSSWYQAAKDIVVVAECTRWLDLDMALVGSLLYKEEEANLLDAAEWAAAWGVECANKRSL